MRSPNGYGSVVKLSGKRRKPYMVRKTVGYDDRAFPVYCVIGYYPTRQDAMIALAQYNNDPYDVDLSKITMKDLFERWSKEAFKHCSPVYDMEYKKIRKTHMQNCIDSANRGYSTRSYI